MASNYGVVAYIKPPMLQGVTQPDLIKFETEYTAYKEKVSSVNAGRQQSDQIPAAAIKDCVDAQTLHALCIMGKIQGASTLEQATVEMVNNWFTSAHTEAPRDLSERIHSALSSVTYKPSKIDPSGAALTFCIDAVKAIDKNNASEIMDDRDKAIFLIDKLLEKLEPELLRERVRMKRSTWTKQEKGNITLFQECASSLAVEVSQNELARARLGGKKRDVTTRGGKPGSKGEKEKDGDSSKDTQPEKRNPFKKQKQSDRKSREWTAKCLNPECDEIHKVKHCDKTSREMKNALMDEHMEKKKSAKVKSLTNSGEGSKQDPGDGRYQVALEDTIPAVALGDTGADVSILPAKLLEEVQRKDNTVTTFQLEKPMKMELACKSMQVEVTKKANLTITIHLPGSNIPVRFRGVQFMIAEFEMDEVLLGRPFLHSIGFNLDQHLAKVSARANAKNLGNEIPVVAAAKYKGLSYQVTDDDPIELPDTMAAGIGKDSETDIQAAFTKILQEATKNGISEEGRTRLERTLAQYRDVFRIKLGPDAPAKVEPLRIQCTDGARPFKTPQRRYAPLQTAFINSTISDLERVGAVRRNPSAKWASPALAVPKPGSKTMRFTVDLRGVNSRTVPQQSAMPHFESKLQEVAGSKYYAKLDLAHGYWQIPLDKGSQEMMSIQTPLGVYTPNWLLQGGSDSGNHFQAVLQNEFSPIDNLLQWIDDFLLHARSEVELLNLTEQFLKICAGINVKVHAEKTTLFCREVNFCGRVISAEGVTHHPRHFESLLSMKRPSFAGELQQLLCATNWMRSSLPAYAQVIAPLHELLESCYQKAGKRTKAAVRRLDITKPWSSGHEEAFTTIKAQLAAAVKLAHVKDSCNLCLFTDASDTHWASILTQVPMSQKKRTSKNKSTNPYASCLDPSNTRRKTGARPRRKGSRLSNP